MRLVVDTNVFVSAALKDYISSGAWSQALKTNVGPSGYDVPEPPTVTTG